MTILPFNIEYIYGYAIGRPSSSCFYTIELIEIFIITPLMQLHTVPFWLAYLLLHYSDVE